MPQVRPLEVDILSKLSNNTTALQSLLNAVNNLPSAGSGGGDVPSVELATPAISVGTDGKITASITQQAGKVAGGTKTATLQQPVQAAQTITPDTTDKTIASGRYLTGTQTIKGDANLKPENIVSGVSIFNVAGTAQTGGGESGVPESCTVEFNVFSNTATTSYLALFWDEPDPRFVPGSFNNEDTVVKNSIVAIYAPYVYGYDIDGDVSNVGENSDYNFFSFFVYGDGSISIG